MDYNLTVGINLNKRKLSSIIPANTTITTLKYIAKTKNGNNYIAEENNKAYFHYVANGEEVSEIFYQKGSINEPEFVLPEDFGTITEVDESAVTFEYITRISHEKTYVISEDFDKRESLDKEGIQSEVEEQVRSYGVPTNSIIGFDGAAEDIPDGFEVTDNDKLVSVGAEAPENGERVWFRKSKNLLKIPNPTQTINGITFTQNSDGSISAVGTATADAKFQSSVVQKVTPNKNYFLSGCPSGGSMSKYRLILRLRSDKTTGVATVSDLGNGTSISASQMSNINYILGEIWVYSGQTVDLTFYPMFAEGSTATDYEPYIEPSINVDEEEWYSKPKVLWTNASPTTDFAGQTISLLDNLANYSHYEILYYLSKDNKETFTTGKIPIDKDTRLSVPRHFIGYRSIQPRGTSMYLSNHSQFTTYGQTTSTNTNGICIPYQILGYK